MTQPQVEIIIVSWNGREDTLRAAQSVLSQISPETLLTVVDNGSSDGTAEELVKRHPAIRLFRHHQNLGFTGGIATAARASSSELLIFLNNDAVVEPGWLEQLVTTMRDAPPDVVAVGGKIVDSSATLVDFVGGVMTFDGHALQTGFRKEIRTVEEPAPGAELLFACGGNMIVRREPFLEMGGFDEDFFAYLEDVDFGWRAWLSGWRVLFQPGAVVRHKSAATSARLGAFERGVLFERNAIQTSIKNYEDESLQRFAGPIFLSLLHRFHHYVVSRNGRVGMLTASPVGAEENGSRMRGKAVIDDDLTAMQFRAMHWFFENQERLLRKRQAVQKRRKRSDREIFERFPIHYVPTYPGDEALMHSTLFRLLQPPVPSAEKSLDEIIRKS